MTRSKKKDKYGHGANVLHKRMMRVGVRDNFKCHYCGVVCLAGGSLPLWLGNQLTADHVVPAFLGGKYELDNLVACCRTCNDEKKNRTYEEFVASPWLVERRKFVSRHT